MKGRQPTPTSVVAPDDAVVGTGTADHDHTDRWRTLVDTEIDRHLAEHTAALLAASPQLRDLTDSLQLVAAGGKRLRALVCLTAARALTDLDRAVPGDVQVATALELFHLAALVHDDVMDRSTQRRGAPTVHRRFAQRHRHDDALGDADHFGASVAVLAGDLCLTWSDDALAAGVAQIGDVDRAAALRTVWSRLRDEAIAG